MYEFKLLFLITSAKIKYILYSCKCLDNEMLFFNVF